MKAFSFLNVCAIILFGIDVEAFYLSNLIIVVAPATIILVPR